MRRLLAVELTETFDVLTMAIDLLLEEVLLCA
jgi:hypothetical protein